MPSRDLDNIGIEVVGCLPRLPGELTGATGPSRRQRPHGRHNRLQNGPGRQGLAGVAQERTQHRSGGRERRGPARARGLGRRCHPGQRGFHHGPPLEPGPGRRAGAHHLPLGIEDLGQPAVSHGRAA
jgi:hypothetical protein